MGKRFFQSPRQTSEFDKINNVYCFIKSVLKQSRLNFLPVRHSEKIQWLLVEFGAAAIIHGKGPSVSLTLDFAPAV